MPDSNGDRYVTHIRLHNKLDEVYDSLDAKIDKVDDKAESIGKEVTKHGVYLKLLLVLTPLTATFGPDLARALS